MEMLQYPFLFLMLLLSLVFVLILFVKEVKRRHKNHCYKKEKLPPGPWKLPLIGNFHQFIMSSSQPAHHTLKELADKHGPLMHLQLGQISVIVVSSPRMAEQVLQNHGQAFASRPDLIVSNYNGSLGISFSPSDDYLKQMRQMCSTEFIHRRKNVAIMEDEVWHLVKSIESLEGQEIDLAGKVMGYLNATISRITVGRICLETDELLITTRKSGSLSGVASFADLLPSLRDILPFFGDMKPKLLMLYPKLDDILDNVIIEEEEKMVKGLLQDEDVHILHLLLQLKNKSNGLKFSITNNNIKGAIFELILAGTITSFSFIEWAMSELMKNPTVMEKAKNEVRQIFKGKKRINAQDVQMLRYLKLFIKETLRLHPPGPLLVPRKCIQQCEIDGYNIPVNTMAIINAWAIGRDPQYWHDAEKFNPERFNNNSIDFKGKHFELIPFGAGTRMCPGYSFGVTNLELLLATLLYHFDWKLSDFHGINAEELDMAENFGAGASRKIGLRLIPRIFIPSFG